MKKTIKYNILGALLLGGCMIAGPAAKAQDADTTAVSTLIKADSMEVGPFLKVPRVQSVISAATVSGATLFKTPTANLSNTLYGRLTGLTVQQGSGEPGYDEANLAIRGVGTYDYSEPTIYVDGFQTTASYFQYLAPAEIESVTILKDAAALAPFGMKGANGVIWVETKRGKVQKPTVQVQLVQGWQQAINVNKPYGSYDYARLYNQAISNDNYALNGNQFVWTPKYTDAQLESYKDGTGTNVDWFDQVLRTATPYTNGNVVFSGGDPTTKYALTFDFMNDLGLYDVPNNDNESNARIQRYNLRSNLDFKFFKIFEAKVDLGGRIEDRRYPNYNGPTLWQNMATYPSNIYPVKDAATGNWSGTTLFPNNPVASLSALGWLATHDRTLQANFNLKERLDFLLPGLYLNEAVSFNTWTRNSSSKTATYARYYNGAQTTTDQQTDLVANGSSPTSQYDWKQMNITAGLDTTWGVNAFSAAVNFFRSSYTIDWSTSIGGENNTSNIFNRYQNFGGRFHYGYDNRYMVEFGFGLSASDSYKKGNRWGFYPALSAGWVLTNERFLNNDKVIDFLKLRASVGKVGNDLSYNGRYLYQQYFASSGTFYTGNNGLTSNSGIVQDYAANPDIFAESSMKYNVGADLTVLTHLSFTLDAFLDKRSGIVTADNTLLGVYGATPPFSNIGKVTNKGIEISADYNNTAGAFTYSVGGAFTYTKNKIDFQAEIPPANSFSRTTGYPIGTTIGLVSEGFYGIDDFDASGNLNADIPTPSFGSVQPGDLRYKDLDGNGKVDQYDVTQIGNPNFPTMTYALHGSVAYKAFDLSFLFQGNAGYGINLLTDAYYQTVALVNNANVFPIAGNAWAYYPDQGIDTRATATYPRLTTVANTNNYQNSTFWMKKGDFVRLRNVQLGYNLPAATLQRMHVDNMRIYVSAVNPFTWSSFMSDYNIDPETTSGYPGIKSYNAGISLTF